MPNLPDPSGLAALAAFASDIARLFAAVACDVAVVLDPAGIVRSVDCQDTLALGALTAGWVGRPLADTVTSDTRHKVLRLLTDTLRDGIGRRREVNLPRAGQAAAAGTADTPDVPLALTALQLGEGGPLIVVGQDLRGAARMQQRFLQVQRELERGYAQALAARRAAAPGRDGTVEPPLDEASRAAFATWLRAERLAADDAADPDPDDRSGAPVAPPGKPEA